MAQNRLIIVAANINTVKKDPAYPSLTNLRKCFVSIQLFDTFKSFNRMTKLPISNHSQLLVGFDATVQLTQVPTVVQVHPKQQHKN